MRHVELTSLDRVLWPRAGFTKGAMVDYYRRVAPAILPHIGGRALTLGRFPAGVDGRGFAQTECRGCPEWMTTAPVRLRDGQVRNYCVVDDLPSLLWVANQSAIELHPFLARAERQHEPTTVVFDLDPGPRTGVLDCCRVALALRDELGAVGLEAFVKTSGSLGLHVQVPLNAPHTYEQTKAFARGLAGRLAARDPQRVIDRTVRAARGGRVLVDWLGNDASRSTIAAYSLRAADRPTVSTPVTWDEVEATLWASAPERLIFEAHDLPARLDAIGDALAPALELRQRLPPAGLSGDRSGRPGG
jgi:bifunctional non-homologous end joining protein LigD